MGYKSITMLSFVFGISEFKKLVKFFQSTEKFLFERDWIILSYVQPLQQQDGSCSVHD